MANGKGPEKMLRYGVLSVSIWRNESATGPWYSVTARRSYQDKAGNWQYADSFRSQDLLLMAKLFDQAHTWIEERMANERQSPYSDSKEEPRQRSGRLGELERPAGERKLSPRPITKAKEFESPPSDDMDDVPF